MSDLPAPLAPPRCDTQGCGELPISLDDLRRSRLLRTRSDAALRAGVDLMFCAWHQTPAGSVAADDEYLAAIANFGRGRRAVKAWRKIADEALGDWVLCSDGRLWHPAVAAAAVNAYARKLCRAAGRAMQRGDIADTKRCWDAITELSAVIPARAPSTRALISRTLTSVAELFARRRIRSCRHNIAPRVELGASVSHKLCAIVRLKNCGSGIRKAVLGALADRAGDDGAEIFASVSLLADLSGFGKTAVQEHMKAFEAEGLLRRVAKRPCRGGYTVEYALDVAALIALPDIEARRRANTLKPESTSPREDLSENATAESTPPGDVVCAEAHRPADGRSSPGEDEPSLEPESNTDRPEPSSPAAARANMPTWDARIAEAIERCGPNVNTASPGIEKMQAPLRALCEPLKGEPCDWTADVLPAIEEQAARCMAGGKPLQSWGHPGIAERAIRNRDSRLCGTAGSQSAFRRSNAPDALAPNSPRPTRRGNACGSRTSSSGRASKPTQDPHGKGRCDADVG